MDQLSFLSTFTDDVISVGNQIEGAILSSPVGEALNSLQNVTVAGITAVYPNFPEFSKNLIATYRFEYHNHVQLPLMNPFHVVLIVVAYLLIVKGGMAVMSLKKDKYELRTYGIFHNLFLTLLSVYMCVEIFRQAWILGYDFAGNTGLHKTEEHGVGHWFFLFFSI